jgi:hypothetical protein
MNQVLSVSYKSLYSFLFLTSILFCVLTRHIISGIADASQKVYKSVGLRQYDHYD